MCRLLRTGLQVLRRVERLQRLWQRQLSKFADCAVSLQRKSASMRRLWPTWSAGWRRLWTTKPLPTRKRSESNSRSVTNSTCIHTCTPCITLQASWRHNHPLQEAELAALRGRVTQAEKAAGNADARKASARLAAAQRKIRELTAMVGAEPRRLWHTTQHNKTKHTRADNHTHVLHHLVQLKEADEAARKRHPDSVNALIRAAAIPPVRGNLVDA